MYSVHALTNYKGHHKRILLKKLTVFGYPAMCGAWMDRLLNLRTKKYKNRQNKRELTLSHGSDSLCVDVLQPRIWKKSCLHRFFFFILLLQKRLLDSSGPLSSASFSDIWGVFAVFLFFLFILPPYSSLLIKALAFICSVFRPCYFVCPLLPLSVCLPKAASTWSLCVAVVTEHVSGGSSCHGDGNVRQVNWLTLSFPCVLSDLVYMCILFISHCALSGAGLNRMLLFLVFWADVIFKMSFKQVPTQS